ncbi:MAG: 2-succinyl-6-hydroxy-2,4-cyclohexadiene-1-carboxylate synthase [Myxococcaceae bacterium]|nr:2-succinyl-6-hydroxy-2,4-cyclohexadiene-1-carboxylate synthase [Myxococcaceae bacterium]
MALNLPIVRWGSGSTPVLLLHGFLGSAQSWEHLRPQWSADLAVTAVDLPGHGQAPLPTAAGTEGFLETIDALAAQIDVPTVVVGYSQGARLALALAARHPRQIAKLVLESGSAGLHRRQERQARREQDEAWARNLEVNGVQSFVNAWEQLPLFSGIRALPAAVQAQLRERRLAHDAHGLAGALRCLGTGVQPDVWPRLPGLRVPTLLVTGEQDVKYTALAQRMAVQLPSAWKVSMPKVGHAPHLECPNRYAQEVLGFITAPWRREFFVSEEKSA